MRRLIQVLPLALTLVCVIGCAPVDKDMAQVHAGRVRVYVERVDAVLADRDLRDSPDVRRALKLEGDTLVRQAETLAREADADNTPAEGDAESPGDAERDNASAGAPAPRDAITPEAPDAP